MDPISTGPRHRWETSATRRSPQFPTRAGRRGVPSSLLEPRAPAGLRGIPGRAPQSRGCAGRMWVRARALQISARAGLRGAPASTLEPWARAGRGWVPMGLLESWARAQRRHVPARVLEPWTRVSRGWIRACMLALRTRARHGRLPGSPPPVILRSRILPVSRRPPTWGGSRQCQVAASTPAHSPSDWALNAPATRSPLRRSRGSHRSRQGRLVHNQPSLRWMDLPSPRNRAAGSVPAMPPAAWPLRNPWLGRGRPQGSRAPPRRLAPPAPSTTRVHRQLLAQPGSRTHMATTRPELKSPPGWAGLANPADHRAARQSTPELDLRRLPMSSAAQS